MGNKGLSFFYMGSQPSAMEFVTPDLKVLNIVALCTWILGTLMYGFTLYL